MIKSSKCGELCGWTTILIVLTISGFSYCASVRGSEGSSYLYDNATDNLVPYSSLDDGRVASDADIGYSPSARSYRKSKFFPLFTIIRFTNEICRTTAEEGGICYTRKQCQNLGGTAHGSCAQGLGVCCQFQATCGGIVTQNGTLFRNPSYPSKYTPTGGSNVCQVRVRKAQNICQLRFNLIKFDIDGPMGPPGTTAAATTNDAGSCKTDALSITSSGATVPQLCGILNDQHLYVDFGTSDTITLNLLLSGNVQRDREWNIEILMIPCNAVSRAPVGCLQYFTGVSGQVESFNYPGSVHLANQDYSICVRMEDGMRAIEWSGCSATSVKISGPTPLPAQTAGQTIMCPATNFNDYLTIMGGVQYPLSTTNAAGTTPGASTSDRFCDASFGTAQNFVRSTVRPFILHFKTDGMEQASAMDASQGFCLKWQQNPQ